MSAQRIQTVKTENYSCSIDSKFEEKKFKWPKFCLPEEAEFGTKVSFLTR